MADLKVIRNIARLKEFPDYYSQSIDILEFGETIRVLNEDYKHGSLLDVNDLPIS